MKNKKITKEEEEDLKEIFSVEKQEEIKDVKISVDRDQFTIRIPKEFAREISITEEDLFRFTLLISQEDENKKILHGELIKDGQ